MGTSGQPQDSGDSGADNVIRFPRDWFGSKEDLIPIGSAADRLDEEAAERTSALSADDFWGEGASALHEAVDAPRLVDDEVSQPSLEALSPGEHSLPAFTASSRWSPRVSRLRATGLPRAPRAALLVTAMVLAAVGLFLASDFGGSSNGARVAARDARSSVKAEQPTFLESGLEELISSSQSALRSAPKAHAVKSPKRHTVRHVARKSGQVKPVDHRVVQTPDGVGTSSHPTSAGDSEPTATPVTDSAPVESTSAQSTTSSSGSSVAPVVAGPSSPGNAGPDCDPQCT
jgi:hypothetical protein